MMYKRGRGIAAIVKVQAAFAGSVDSTGRALIYAEGRSHLKEQPISDELYRMLLTRPTRKAYFHAVWIGPREGWVIGALTVDQPW